MFWLDRAWTENLFCNKSPEFSTNWTVEVYDHGDEMGCFHNIAGL